MIIATGAPWATTARGFFDGEPTPGGDASLPNVLTPEQLILEGKEIPGRRVVVYDCEADLTGIGVAHHVQARGYEVELISSLADIGMRAHMTLMSVPLRGQPGATFVNEATQEVRIDCDAVVMLALRSSDDALYQALTADPDRLEGAGIQAVYRIGVCEAAQNLSEVLFSGQRLARQIETEDPEVALPARRH